MPDFKTKVTFPDVKIIDASDLAIRVDIDGQILWIPSSLVDDDSEVWQKGDVGELIIAEFFAKEKGLI